MPVPAEDATCPSGPAPAGLPGTLHAKCGLWAREAPSTGAGDAGCSSDQAAPAHLGLAATRWSALSRARGSLAVLPGSPAFHPASIKVFAADAEGNDHADLRNVLPQDADQPGGGRRASEDPCPEDRAGEQCAQDRGRSSLRDSFADLNAADFQVVDRGDGRAFAVEEEAPAAVLHMPERDRSPPP